MDNNSPLRSTLLDPHPHDLDMKSLNESHLIHFLQLRKQPRINRNKIPSLQRFMMINLNHHENKMDLHSWKWKKMKMKLKNQWANQHTDQRPGYLVILLIFLQFPRTTTWINLLKHHRLHHKVQCQWMPPTSLLLRLKAFKIDDDASISRKPFGQERKLALTSQKLKLASTPWTSPRPLFQKAGPMTRRTTSLSWEPLRTGGALRMAFGPQPRLEQNKHLPS